MKTVWTTILLALMLCCTLAALVTLFGFLEEIEKQARDWRLCVLWALGFLAAGVTELFIAAVITAINGPPKS